MGAFQTVRVVLDTNVMISSLLFEGETSRIVPLWKDGTIRPLICQEMMAEIVRVLAYPKFRLSQREIEFLLSVEILPWFEVVQISDRPSWVKADPSDDPFIWCAVSGNARFLVSGDEHLLDLTNPPIPILTVRAFIQKVMETG
jgi:uncharacterized protein